MGSKRAYEITYWNYTPGVNRFETCVITAYSFDDALLAARENIINEAKKTLFGVKYIGDVEMEKE